ncbi:MAG TPA: hypothetical protein VMH80_00895 [Bryobacteraceae bacterium]|nr:hypothetical protein [Bryobacteraceae bacterium]
MKTADFKAALTPNGQITVPPEIASQVPAGEPIQVVLQWDVSGEDAAWRFAGRKRFEAAYSADDSVYEQLINGTATG